MGTLESLELVNEEMHTVEETIAEMYRRKDDLLKRRERLMAQLVLEEQQEGLE